MLPGKVSLELAGEERGPFRLFLQVLWWDYWNKIYDACLNQGSLQRLTGRRGESQEKYSNHNKAKRAKPYCNGSYLTFSLTENVVSGWRSTEVFYLQAQCVGLRCTCWLKMNVIISMFSEVYNHLRLRIIVLSLPYNELCISTYGVGALPRSLPC